MKTVLTPKVRVVGAIMGLCAGDRNGGPIRMVINSLLLFWSILSIVYLIKTGIEGCQKFGGKEWVFFGRYHREIQKLVNTSYWYLKLFDFVFSLTSRYLGPPYDSEKAFDTGETFLKVISMHALGHDMVKVAQQKNSFGVNCCHRGIIWDFLIFWKELTPQRLRYLASFNFLKMKFSMLPKLKLWLHTPILLLISLRKFTFQLFEI